MSVTTAFGDSIRKFAAKCDDKADLVIRKIFFDVTTALVMKSPVGDPKYWQSPAPPGYVGGRFRANWQYGIDRLNALTTEARDKGGGATITRIQGSVGSTMLGHSHYITNTLPYAKRLEEGWSWRQAPAGVVMVTVLEFDPIVRRAAAEA